MTTPAYSPRLAAICARLNECTLVTAVDLATLTGASDRTIYRDINRLRERGFPVESEPGVGYLLRNPAPFEIEETTHEQSRESGVRGGSRGRVRKCDGTRA